MHHFKSQSIQRNSGEQSAYTSIVKELFRGFTPLLLRQSIAWVLWMEMDQVMKTVLRSRLKIERTEKIPNYYLLAGSFVVALTGTIVIMPFDSIKTNLQKADLSVLTQK
jgi:hypothetical protein